MQYNSYRETTTQEQMFVVSECLLRLGYRRLAVFAQEANYWEFVSDFVKLIIRESVARQDDGIIDRLQSANLIG